MLLCYQLCLETSTVLLRQETYDIVVEEAMEAVELSPHLM